MNFLLPRAPRAVHGRERHPQPAQPPHPARRAGARPARSGSRYLDEAIELFGDDTDVAVRLAPLADLGHRAASSTSSPSSATSTRYLHDQTLRLLNQGYTGSEIAEELELPPEPRARRGTPAATTARSATTSRPIYQRYLGWFDGNPAHLWQHPPEARGASATSSSWAAPTRCSPRPARRSRDGDFRWVAEVVNHARLRRPRQHARPRTLQADALEQLGYGAENAHLAQLLPDRRPGAARRRRRHADRDRAAPTSSPASPSSSSSTRSRSGSTARAPGDRQHQLHWHFTDTGDEHAPRRSSNGVLTHRRGGHDRRRRRHRRSSSAAR